MSPLYKPNLKLLKIVLTGNDILVSHAAKAYAYLRIEEANLFAGLEVRFYHVPLSQVSTTYGQLPGIGTHSHADLPEPMLEPVDRDGSDIHIGRFLGHMDSWYERNVMQTVHHILRLLPPVSELHNLTLGLS